MKPVIIYVSGAPGSGKTTLAKLLSEQLYLPHISSDLVHGGIAFAGQDHNRSAAIKDAFIPLLIDFAKKNISFVVDHVLQKDIAKATIIERLEPYATLINVHTYATNPIERYVHRTKISELPDIVRRRDLLLGRAGHHRRNLVNTADPMDLGVPAIAVNTDNGYVPGLTEIILFINSHK